MAAIRPDEIGGWSEVKLQIIRKYSKAYATILNKQSSIRHFAYIDGFAGAGVHISRETGKPIEGSPLIALGTQPPFSHYHFIDMDGERAEGLRKLAAGRPEVSVYEGDCNAVLKGKVFPKCLFKDYRRALCILDPYNLNPNWSVVEEAGRMKSVEILHTFMIMDAHMNVLWRNPEKVDADQIARMNAFWGDDSWRKIGYVKEEGLFGDIDVKAPALDFVNGYVTRLKEVAGFRYVVEPLPMRNSTGGVVYYLVFATPNETGYKIARDVFKKFR
jgi:three-Cys-motif partner protein